MLSRPRLSWLGYLRTSNAAGGSKKVEKLKSNVNRDEERMIDGTVRAKKNAARDSNRVFYMRQSCGSLLLRVRINCFFIDFVFLVVFFIAAVVCIASDEDHRP